MATENKFTEDDTLCVNTIRCLSADIVQKANSGHPGMPIGMAPIAHVLFSRFFKHNPANSKWANRDRFVLSNGHGCALLYSMLHLNGYKVTMDDLKAFRQLGSITPGHPEAGVTDGVEVTTGPLGQGIANAVGLAIAEAHMAAVFNKPGFELFNNHTYVFCGDGCLQEGISGEAASIAGHLGLGKLIVLYDDNHITIDGDTKLSFTEDVLKRHEAYGWHVQHVENGNTDLHAIEAAIAEAKKVSDKPSIIAIRTTIAFMSVRQGHHDTHGSPLGADDIAQLKTKCGFDPAQSFAIPEKVSAIYHALKAKGEAEQKSWDALFAEYTKQYPHEAAEFQRRFAGKLPENWQAKLPVFKPEDKADATRNHSGKVLNVLAEVLPELIGGSADLTPSTKTAMKAASDFQKATPQGRYIRYGIREHAMFAIGNGLHAYGGIIPFTSTFLNFIEYGFPSVRLAALSHFQQILVMTHDSIGLGEDGPTHQPVEAVALCRATPNVVTIRPADGVEVVGSYIAAIQNTHGPTVLVFSRQNVPSLKHSSIDGVLKGAYTVHDSTEGKETPDLIFVGTGSEVGLCLDAAQKLQKKVRVVSMPSWELFARQPVEYRRSVFVPGVPVLSVEALATTGWERYAHLSVGMRTFGTSAPDKHAFKKFGFDAEQVAAKAEFLLAQMEDIKKNFGGVPPLATHFDF